MSPSRKRKARVLLAAAAGATVISMTGCTAGPVGNLMVRPICGADGGPPNCYVENPPEDAGTADSGTDSGTDAGKTDAGTGDAGTPDGGTGGDQ